MELSVKRKLPVFILGMSNVVQWFIFVFLAIIFSTITFLVLLWIYQNSDNASWLVILILTFALGLLPSIIYVVYLVVDYAKYATSTIVKLTETGLMIHSESIKATTDVSLSFDDLKDIKIVQSLPYKMFGICGFSATSHSGEYYLWGFEYDEAKEFLNKLHEQNKIRVKQG